MRPGPPGLRGAYIDKAEGCLKRRWQAGRGGGEGPAQPEAGGMGRPPLGVGVADRADGGVAAGDRAGPVGKYECMRYSRGQLAASTGRREQPDCGRGSACAAPERAFVRSSLSAGRNGNHRAR